MDKSVPAEAPLSPLFREDFQNPPSRFRAMPFWSWNGRLDADEMEHQIDCFKKMGFGGFHMHPRTGLDTPYLSPEFMEIVRRCVCKAEKEKMEACIYDEDRWPSGFAGGLVTQEPEYRARHLLLTRTPYRNDGAPYETKEYWSAQAVRTENGNLLASYDITLDNEGCLEGYRRAGSDAPVRGTRWYVYVETPPCDPWYNGQTYADTLNKDAIKKFIDITYDAYLETVGEQFGKTIPSIFTDEPQFAHKTTLCFPEEDTDVFLPWTDDFPETYLAAYGENLLEKLPELLWELPHGQVSATRYRYHDHITERFTQAFADQCGSWCQEHGLLLTGHMMEEPTLKSQTAALGETMRAYRSFGLPGVDMLCNRYEYTTVKQAASAAHQYGRFGVLSELCGVTSWSFDFRGHKQHGDWQAALGVTRRVPHCAMFSMKGEAKRDYPASIGYQSPWYAEYHRVEDHFARVNAAMTRGKPVVRIGVIHPIESYWLHWGPSAQTALQRDELDRRFQDLTEWLLFGTLDFDFISESLLPEQCTIPGAPLSVGEMAYDVILVPGCETLRGTTITRLDEFRRAGGRLIFLGEAPALADALPSAAPRTLWAAAEHIPFERCSLFGALESCRTVGLRKPNGEMTENLVAQLREEEGCRWLFLAQGREAADFDFAARQEIRITLNGCYRAERWDTLDGSVHPESTCLREGKTLLTAVLFQNDSLLLRLIPSCTDVAGEAPAPIGKEHPLPVPTAVRAELSEPNVLLLDCAEFSLDDGEWEPERELIQIDTLLRDRLGFPSKRKAVAQPWSLPEEAAAHFVRLRYSFHTEITVESPVLALENAAETGIWLDGELISAHADGFYVDPAIETVPLERLTPGQHLLELRVPFTRRGSLEWNFLLGSFGVRLRGTCKTLISLPKELGFGDLTRQELPFYGGNVAYHIPVSLPESGRLRVHIPHYRGSLMTLAVDGREAGSLIFSPYDAWIPLEAGAHELTVTLFGNRVNTFGALHMFKNQRWLSPASWRHTGDRWSEEYVWEPFGILSRPVLSPEKTEGNMPR